MRLSHTTIFLTGGIMLTAAGLYNHLQAVSNRNSRELFEQYEFRKFATSLAKSDCPQCLALPGDGREVFTDFELGDRVNYRVDVAGSIRCPGFWGKVQPPQVCNWFGYSCHWPPLEDELLPIGANGSADALYYTDSYGNFNELGYTIRVNGMSLQQAVHENRATHTYRFRITGEDQPAGFKVAGCSGGSGNFAVMVTKED